MSNTPQDPTRKIDVLQMLRDAQGEAADVSAAQAHLKGMLDEEVILEMTKNPTIAKLQAMLDKIRIVADEAAALEAGSLPPPYGLIVTQAAHWIGVADDAFKALQ